VSKKERVSRRRFIEAAGWRFAASMPEIPHEYTGSRQNDGGRPEAPARSS
jgi:hypothetical protein